MRTSLSTLLICLYLFSCLHAGDLKPGDEIKIVTIRNTSVFGEYQGETGDSYIIDHAGMNRDTISFTEIHQVYRNESQVKKGFLAGGAIGVMVGAASSSNKDNNSETGKRIKKISTGLVIGGMVGALIGTNFHSYSLATVFTETKKKELYANLPVGANLKILTTNDQVIEGKLTVVDGNLVVVDTKNSGETMIFDSEIDRLYRRKSHFKKGALIGVLVGSITSPLLFEIKVGKDDNSMSSEVAEATLYSLGCFIGGGFIGSRFKKFDEVLPDDNQIGFEIRQSAMRDRFYCITLTF